MDPNKDQTYFLSMTPGANFRNVLFPLGGMAKDDVRRIVDEPLKGCRVLSKAESMGKFERIFLYAVGILFHDG